MSAHIQASLKHLQSLLDNSLILTDSPICSSGMVRTAGLVRIGTGQCLLESLDGIQLKLRLSETKLYQPEGANLGAFVRAMEYTLRAVWHLLHGHIVMRASAVLLPDNTAALWCGSSAAGKSAIACYAALHGYPLISDDISCLVFQDGRMCVQSCVDLPKLAPCGIELMSQIDGNVPTIRPNEAGYIEVDVSSASGIFPISSVFCLQAEFVDTLSCQQVQGFGQFPLLLQQIYMPSAADVLLSKSILSEQFFVLGIQAQLYQVQRPVNEDSLSGLLALLGAQSNRG